MKCVKVEITCLWKNILKNIDDSLIKNLIYSLKSFRFYILLYYTIY